MNIISYPFGWIMYFCYSIINNYGLALILFTLFTKIILFPLSVKQQKNTARTQALAPQLEKLKKKCGTNKQKYNEEMMRLYQEKNINPMSGCLPLVIQMPILMGLYYVIYNPLTHILRLSTGTINAAKGIIAKNADKIQLFTDITNNKSYHSRPQLYVVDAIQKHPEAFSNSKDISASALEKIQNFDYSFFGLDLGKIPTWGWNLLILIPLLSFLTNLGYTFYTQHKMKKNNPSANQMGMGMSAMLYVMPIVSAVFTFQFPAGVGIYWIISTVFSFFQTMLLYKLYSAERVAAIDLKKGPKTKKKKSMYERMVEAQQAQLNGGVPLSTSNDDDTPEEKLSKSAAKELQRKRLNEARRRMAEKYGEDYDDSAD